MIIEEQEKEAPADREEASVSSGPEEQVPQGEEVKETTTPTEEETPEAKEAPEDREEADASVGPEEQVPQEPVKKKKVAHAEEIEKVQLKKKVKIVKKPLKPIKKRRAEKVEYTGRNIGIEIERPTKLCTDLNCPYHGKLSVRGQILKGICVSTKMNKTAVIQRERRLFNQKFERYEKRTKKISAHNPECLEIKIGEPVAIMECKPISKTVSFVIIGRT
jgi:small subunit ribosomal protein S17